VDSNACRERGEPKRDLVSETWASEGVRLHAFAKGVEGKSRKGGETPLDSSPGHGEEKSRTEKGRRTGPPENTKNQITHGVSILKSYATGRIQRRASSRSSKCGRTECGGGEKVL